MNRFSPSKANLIIAALASVLAMGAIAEAAPTNEQREAHQHRIFSSFDQNKNGKLTRQEFVDAIIKNLFSDFDKNKNGLITKTEFLEYAKDKKQAAKEYPLMDTEAKGHITLKNVSRNKPLIQRLELEFKKLDRSDKGYVTLSDLPDLTPGN
jgi:Ca2+-binding EF-hand superfamily protein